MNKVSAVIVAGGKGKRIGADINKVFLNIKGKPILYYSLKAFSENKNIDEIVLVTQYDEVNYCMSEIVNKYNFSKVSKVVPGGKERQNSVLNGLRAINNSDIVLIHDGARPFVNDKIIKEGIDNADIYGACACGIVPKDTIKIRDNQSFSQGTLSRDSLFNVQTPQCFKYDIIFECHKNAEAEGVKVTDDTSIVERYGYKVYLYDGSYNNIKITTPEDLIIGEKIAQSIDY